MGDERPAPQEWRTPSSLGHFSNKRAGGYQITTGASAFAGAHKLRLQGCAAQTGTTGFQPSVRHPGTRAPARQASCPAARAFQLLEGLETDKLTRACISACRPGLQSRCWNDPRIAHCEPRQSWICTGPTGPRPATSHLSGGTAGVPQTGLGRATPAKAGVSRSQVYWLLVRHIQQLHLLTGST